MSQQPTRDQTLLPQTETNTPQYDEAHWAKQAEQHPERAQRFTWNPSDVVFEDDTQQ